MAERINRLKPTGINAQRTRVHGDYHLGQTIVTDQDIFIIDFEGEPMRPLAERRTKYSPLKDIAGMLRSFAYLAAAAERELSAAAGPMTAGRLRALTHEMSATFLREYESRIVGCPSHPADTTQAAVLLHLFLLEKALYEVTYELANRPDWLDIPLASVLALLNLDARHLEDVT
jgi:trehalose synthase-fused probable maltokinase